MGSRAGRLLLGVETLKGAQPPSPLYILEVWAAIHTRESLLLVLPYPSPSSSSPTVLGEALRDCHAPPPPPCRRVAAGWSLPQPLLAGSRRGRRHRAARVLNAEAPFFRCLDRNQPRSESLRVRLPHPRSCNASASRSTRVCRFTPLPLVARLLHRLILVLRRKF